MLAVTISRNRPCWNVGGEVLIPSFVHDLYNMLVMVMHNGRCPAPIVIFVDFNLPIAIIAHHSPGFINKHHQHRVPFRRLRSVVVMVARVLRSIDIVMRRVRVLVRWLEKNSVGFGTSKKLMGSRGPHPRSSVAVDCVGGLRNALSSRGQHLLLGGVLSLVAGGLKGVRVVVSIVNAATPPYGPGWGW